MQMLLLCCMLVWSSEGSSDGFSNVVVRRSHAGTLHTSIVVNASLPEMPPGLPGVVFGSAAMTTRENVVFIAGPLSLSLGNPGRRATEYYRAAELRQVTRQFVYWLNHERGGLRIGDRTYNLAVLLMDDQGSAETVANTTAWAMRTTRACFALGPWGEELTRLSAMQARLDGHVMISAGATSADIFAANNGSLFGLLPPYPGAVRRLFGSLLGAAEEADARGGGECGAKSCRESLVLGMLGPCESWDRIAGSSVFSRAAANETTVASEAGDEQWRAALRRLQEQGVTVLKVCGADVDLLKTVTSMMEDLDFNVLALIADGIDTPEFAWMASGGWWQGGHVIDAVPWTQSYPLRGTWSNLTSKEFAERYQALTGWFSTYRGAAQFAALSVLSAAMEAAGSVEKEAVVAQLRAMELSEFYGNISFDANGQATQSFIVLQSQPLRSSASDPRNLIVFPRSVAEAALVFPRPSWAQMRCSYQTMQCSGRGHCDRAGTCKCKLPWGGKSCEVELAPAQRPSVMIALLAILGFLGVVLTSGGVVLGIVRRRRKHLAEGLAALDRGVYLEDLEVQRSAKRRLLTLGWGPLAVDEEVGRIRRRHSLESGVCLAYLLSDEFLRMAQARSGIEDPTFYELKDVLFFGPEALGANEICPRDGGRGCALVDILPRQHRGRCTHFLSWTWGYKLSVVRCALQHWLEVNDERCPASQVFLYMCFFVNNQYRILVSNEKTGSEDLEEVFEKNLARIGKVVAVLDTWDSPRYLTRIWTIFEQVIAIKLNVPVTMVLPKNASCEILREFERGKDGIIKVKNSLTKVDSERAQAFAPEDEMAVKGLISRTLGFKSVDEKIVEFMIKWVCTVMECHMRRLVSVHGRPCEGALRPPPLPSAATVISLRSGAGQGPSPVTEEGSPRGDRAPILACSPKSFKDFQDLV